MTKTIYICTGSCHGVATEAEWRAGAKTCGAKNCERRSLPLEKRSVCKKCGAHYKPEEAHRCA